MKSQKKTWKINLIKKNILNIYINFPTLSYNHILLKLSEKCDIKTYYYSLKEFNNFKSNYNQKITNKKLNKDYLNDKTLNHKQLLKANIIFQDKNEINHYIKIFGIINSMKNLYNINII